MSKSRAGRGDASDERGTAARLGRTHLGPEDRGRHRSDRQITRRSRCSGHHRGRRARGDPATLGRRRPGTLPSLSKPQAADGTAFSGTFVGQFTQNSDPGNPGQIAAVLRHNGTKVSGEYTIGLGIGAIQHGTVNGDALFFEWEYAGNYGRGVLHAIDGRNGFSGTWGYRESADNAGTWTARHMSAH